MQAAPYPVPAKQHDPEEARFEEERGEHFIGQQRPGDAAGEVGKTAPVGAELVGHDQPRDHAHAEVDGEDLRPEMVEIAVGVVVGFQPKAFEHRQEIVGAGLPAKASFNNALFFRAPSPASRLLQVYAAEVEMRLLAFACSNRMATNLEVGVNVRSP